jgi:hypothetical protein
MMHETKVRADWWPSSAMVEKDCASTDARVRVDTAAMQEWIARVIREELGTRLER